MKRRMHERVVAQDPAAFVDGDRRLSLKGVEKEQHFCELKTSIYPVSGIFFEAWRKTILSVLFGTRQGMHISIPTFIDGGAAAGKDN